MMRIKYLWDYLPLPKQLKLVWDRLMFSRLTAAYFIFTIVHCFIQVALQSWAFRINADAMDFLYGLSLQANATDKRVPAFSTSDGLQLCSDVPGDPGVEITCQTLWGGQNSDNGQSESSSSTYSTVVLSSTSQTTSTTSTSTTFTSSASSSVTPEPANNGANIRVDLATFLSSTTINGIPTATLVVVPTSVPGDNLLEVGEESEDDDDDFDDTASVSSDDDDDEGTESDDDDDDDDDDILILLSKRQFESVLKRRGVPLEFEPVVQNGELLINVSGSSLEQSPVTLSKDCLWALNWPVGMLQNTKREDVVFIGFQLWVAGMSIVALLNESIPHVFAALLTHMLATGWSGFQINHTADFRSNFNKAITNGACGVPLLPNYWEERARAEYPTLALNCLALLVSAFLTWRLVKLFGWQTFKRVGASLTINRIYKLVLVLSIVLQLSLFFMAATVSLWLDNLFNGIAAQVGWYVTFYKATAIATEILLIPWLVMGWFAVRRELRLAMFMFLFLSILYLAALGSMFLSTSFRWLFITWRFFSLMASASVLLALTAFVLGVICRFNFGKGLPRYLNAQEPLPGEDFAPVTYGSDPEKVAFPSNDGPVPTFSAAFGKGPEVPPPSRMFPPSRMGPRFFTPSEPFETPRNVSPITVPTLARTQSATSSSDYSGADVHRSNSHGSEKSFGSLASYYSYSTSESGNHSRNNSQDPRGKRWVIE